MSIFNASCVTCPMAEIDAARQRLAAVVGFEKINYPPLKKKLSEKLAKQDWRPLWTARLAVAGRSRLQRKHFRLAPEIERKACESASGSWLNDFFKRRHN